MKKKPSTTTERQRKRNKPLNEIAGNAGYFYKGKPSWSAYVTAVKNGKVPILSNPNNESPRQ